MLKRLKNLKVLLKLFKYSCQLINWFKSKIPLKLINWFESKFSKTQTNKTQSIERIPDAILDIERIARAVYSPINLSKKQDRINNNLFKPPNGYDEVSVNRLNYTTPTFLKTLAKQSDNPAKRKEYFGFSVLLANEIRKYGFDVIYSPLEDNKFHSDVKIGCFAQAGVPLDAGVRRNIGLMVKEARLYVDPDSSSETWKGADLI